ncbi:zinc-ribbon domain-containing protein [Frigidibacter oleivorans]|uniref:zinc-ribbon domain-containing protein n=1 Tax=Frigidibacter oleivorans TaxID=2487129 RepID=UPI000F8F5DDB|nr:zinc-ribbon domain-containing protein [Frigidibacter oleivorans]
MRLTCPNCNAQYEVDERVIPEAGRDVQCSNCGQTWFQLPLSRLAPPPPEPDEDLPFDEGALAADLPEAPLDEDFGETAPPEDGTEPPEDAPAMPAAAEAAEDDLPPGLAEALAEDDRPAPEAKTDDEAPADVWPEEVWPADAQAEHYLQNAEAPLPDPEAPAPAIPGTLRRRTLDAAVLNVLREEAEREARARHRASAVEVQPELALDPARPGHAAPPPSGADPSPAPERSERGAHLRGEDPELEAEIAAANRPPRRDLLPDIEMINSTLRATSDRGRDAAAQDAPETVRRARSGFRLGFGLSLAAAAVVLGLYISAPALGRSVPALMPALTAYVATLDRGRLWLDGQIAARIGALQDGS